ncbi:MAG: fibronectin type III domain-containing protein [Gammaproteobacteria bacterium]|nr:fibronectin type III domain-containing protein [Gammaproteobacteria bacterium]
MSWSAPTTNTDGSALTDLAGYQIYYGTSATALTQSVNIPGAAATSYVLQNLAGGTWYFEVTAVTNSGAQSAPSAVVSKTVT